MESYEERSRPLGITIIAAVLGISALLALIVLILGLTHVSMLGLGAQMSPAESLVLLIAVGLGIFEVALAWGLWTLKPWAFWTAVIVEAIRFIVALYTVFLLQRVFISGILGLIIPLIVLIYLFADSGVRAAFRPSSE
ncbi:MAG: hypothetical protein ACJ788_24315 [Ktedonobacteraceae bacterium]